MDHAAAERFRALIAEPAADPPLDEGAWLIAAVAGHSDVDAGLARLDEMAGAALAFPEARTPAGLAKVLFVDWAYRGNTADYGDPRNSFLPEVIDRRLGLPITLSVLMIEVGRRIGVGVHGVGMPGHFLVGVDSDPDRFVDPFHAGVMLDREGCRQRLVGQYGPQMQFDDRFLAPTPARAILLRILTNLGQTYAHRRSPDARWVGQLRLAFPELPAAERRAIAEVFASVGAFGDAAVVLTELADRATADDAEALARQATAFRARSN
ncbi:MAG: transglutaminase family protein [Acidimicrobiia bacterium]|nr:transglutaminase family protein [Acidimicrobiia bacterium]